MCASSGFARAAWMEAWRASGTSEPAGLLAFVERQYAEPHRAYHNLDHVEECFAALSPAAHLAERLHEVQLALWFHDSVYDPRAHDNEELSAALASEKLSAAGLDSDRVDRIAECILATRHEGPAARPDAQLVADADLSILAAPVERFEEYQQQIRAEYSFMNPDDFHSERRRILSRFLARDSIYQTRWFHERLEHAARANIMRELEAPGGAIR